jgi:hypothetical protein
MSNIDLERKKLADFKKGDKLTLCFLLNREKVSSSPMAGGYRVKYVVSATILVFDFETLSITATFPVSVVISDFEHTEPSEEQKRKQIRKLFLENVNGLNIFDEFVKRLPEIKIKEKFSSTIGITKVSLLKHATPYFREEDKINFAQSFSNYLSKNQNVSIVPYTKQGHAIEKVMKTKFTGSGKVYELKVRPPDYNIHLIIRGFQKKLSRRVRGREIWIYASYFRAIVIHPELEETYFDDKFKFVDVAKIIPGSAMVDSYYYWKITEKLFNGLTKQVSKPTSEWAEEYGYDIDEEKFEKFKKILDDCK